MWRGWFVFPCLLCSVVGVVVGSLIFLFLFPISWKGSSMRLIGGGVFCRCSRCDAMIQGAWREAFSGISSFALGPKCASVGLYVLCSNCSLVSKA